MKLTGYCVKPKTIKKTGASVRSRKLFYRGTCNFLCVLSQTQNLYQIVCCIHTHKLHTCIVSHLVNLLRVTAVTYMKLNKIIIEHNDHIVYDYFSLRNTRLHNIVRVNHHFLNPKLPAFLSHGP